MHFKVKLTELRELNIEEKGIDYVPKNIYISKIIRNNYRMIQVQCLINNSELMKISQNYNYSIFYLFYVIKLYI